MGIRVDRSVEARGRRRPHLFLSHSSKDQRFTRDLAEELSTCSVDVWLDEWELRPGDGLLRSLASAIQRSRYVGVVLSEDFTSSAWAMKELEIALERERSEEAEVVVPIVREGVPVPPRLESRVCLRCDDGYFPAVARLSGIVHGLSMSRLEDGIRRNEPRSLGGVHSVLEYAGHDPHLVLDAQDFDEIARAGGQVDGDRILFSPVEIARSPLVSGRIQTLMGDISRGTRW